MSADPKPVRAWWPDWILIVASPVLILLLFPATWPRWSLMWTMAAAIYGGCKWLTWRGTPVRSVPVWRHMAYLLAWPGLDAKSFLESGYEKSDPAALPMDGSQISPKGWQAGASRTQPLPPRHSDAIDEDANTRRTMGHTPPPTAGEWLFAESKLGFGIVLLGAIASWVPGEFPYLVGWVGMVGIIMTLHFGSFHMLSCAWRRSGVNAQPLMNWPIAAHGLSDFWGRRWNTAFRDLTHRFLFRPLAIRIGPRAAIGAGFLFSGVLHDLVVSVPARGGYGLPSLYFAIQGLALIAERSSFGRRIGLGRGLRGWLFAAVVLLAPVRFLFHAPFVVGIIVPFMRAIRAIE